MIEIRWHGRGGQGAITAAKILATTAFKSGYTGAVMVPTFGTERRGAPIFSSLKIAREKIYDLSPIETPDVVVVLDHLLLDEVDVAKGLKDGGLIVLNTSKPLAAYDFGGARLAVADVNALSMEAGLPQGRVNSGIIGVLCRALDIVPFDVVLQEIEAEFTARNRRPTRRRRGWPTTTPSWEWRDGYSRVSLQDVAQPARSGRRRQDRLAARPAPHHRPGALHARQAGDRGLLHLRWRYWAPRESRCCGCLRPTTASGSPALRTRRVSWSYRRAWGQGR